MTLKKVVFKDYVKQLYPDEELAPQQMSAIGRWLRKKGFNVIKDYSAEYGKIVTVITFDNRKQLPTHCTVRIAHRSVLKPAGHRNKVLPLPVKEKKISVNFQEAINYIHELHSVIEILMDELERQKLINEEAQTAQVPSPTLKVKKALEMLSAKFPGEDS